MAAAGMSSLHREAGLDHRSLELPTWKATGLMFVPFFFPLMNSGTAAPPLALVTHCRWVKTSGERSTGPSVTHTRLLRSEEVLGDMTLLQDTYSTS